jgi:hypothetical protein
MITKTKISKVQRQIKSAIRKIEQENSVQISFGTARYNDIDYKSTMTVKTTEKSAKTIKVTNSENTSLSKLFGFDKNIVGETFRSNGKEFKITEFKTRNRKYPIIATTLDGRGYKFSPMVIKNNLQLKTQK